MFPPGRGRANGSGLWVIGRAGCRGWARHTVGVGPGCPCAVVERPLRGYEDGGGGWGCSAERGTSPGRADLNAEATDLGGWGGCDQGCWTARVTCVCPG